MVKGVAVTLKSYEETIPKLLKMIKFDDELKKHEKIILKPNLISGEKESSTSVDFMEQVLKFCMENKNPGTDISIVEGCDGRDTMDVFEELGYSSLAEKYGIGLIDLNDTETEEIENQNFLKFTEIMYPKILLDGFIISIPLLQKNDQTGISASLDSMIGAFPAKHYRGFFSKTKSKLNRYSKQHQIYDILKCKMPDFTIMDVPVKGIVLAGQPLEMDKQAAKALGLNPDSIEHLNLIEKGPQNEDLSEKEINELIKED